MTDLDILNEHLCPKFAVFHGGSKDGNTEEVRELVPHLKVAVVPPRRISLKDAGDQGGFKSIPVETYVLRGRNQNVGHYFLSA